MTKWQTVYLQRSPMQTGLLHIGYRTVSPTPPQMPQFGGCMGLTANLVGLTAECWNTVIVEMPWLHPFALNFSQQINQTRRPITVRAAFELFKGEKMKSRRQIPSDAWENKYTRHMGPDKHKKYISHYLIPVTQYWFLLSFSLHSLLPFMSTAGLSIFYWPSSYPFIHDICISLLI